MEYPENPKLDLQNWNFGDMTTTYIYLPKSNNLTTYMTSLNVHKLSLHKKQGKGGREIFRRMSRKQETKQLATTNTVTPGVSF